jgi:hypothetical protein
MVENDRHGNLPTQYFFLHLPYAPFSQRKI